MEAEIFEGIRLSDKGEFPKLTMPRMESWRNLPVDNASRAMSCVYEAKPMGDWAAIIRKGNGLVSTSGNIPLAVDWVHVYHMLRRENGVLYAVSDGETIVAEAIGVLGSTATPLVPGFKKTSVQLHNQDGIVEEHNLGEDWPEGLATPWILHFGAFNSIHDIEHRQSYLDKTNGHGLWLLSVIGKELVVYEVLS